VGVTSWERRGSHHSLGRLFYVKQPRILRKKSIRFNVPAQESKRQQKRRLTQPATPLAGFFRRLGGFLLDAALMCAVLVIVLEAATQGGSYGTSVGYSVLAYSVLFGAWFIYSTVTTVRLGATIGQGFLGIRTVNAVTGARLTWPHAATRAAIAFLPPYLTFLLTATLVEVPSITSKTPPVWHMFLVAGAALLTVVSMLWMVMSKRAQTLYDKFSGSAAITGGLTDDDRT